MTLDQAVEEAWEAGAVVVRLSHTRRYPDMPYVASVRFDDVNGVEIRTIQQASTAAQAVSGAVKNTTKILTRGRVR